MSTRFDDWIRATLRPRDVARPKPGEIRRIIADLQPRHRRRNRVALTAVTAVAVVGLVVLANPRRIGSDAGRFEITRRLDDGRLVIQQPLTGSGTTVRTLEEIEDWNRAHEKSVAGEERVYEYSFTRYQGKATWNVGYIQKDDEEKIWSRQPTYGPKTTISTEALRKIIPHYPALHEAIAARQAIVCPSERHVIDGVPVDFEVWAIDVPGVGRIEYGEGKPPTP